MIGFQILAEKPKNRTESHKERNGTAISLGLGPEGIKSSDRTIRRSPLPFRPGGLYAGKAQADGIFPETRWLDPMSEPMVMVDDEEVFLDPLDSEETPLAAPPRVPPPATPVPSAAPIELDEPVEPIIVTPDRPDQNLAEPIGDSDAPVEFPDVDPNQPSPPADPGGLMDRLETLETGLGRKLDALQTAFDREIRAESTREKVVDRLHAELQEYKQGLILGILRPVFIDLIQLHDDIGKMAGSSATYPETNEFSPEVRRLVGLILGYQQAIEDILDRQGVETFTQPDAAFDPRRQRALSTTPTDDPSLNKTVATRVRPGFQTGDKVIRPEFVTVFAHKPT